MPVSMRSGIIGVPGPLNFPVGLDATKTFFIDQNGNPCFGLGDAPQELMEQLSKPQIEQYLADRQACGINILWMIAADNIYPSNPPNNFNGDAPFSGANFTNFNPAYWSYVDYVMQRCLVYGITVLFMPAFMGLSNTQGYFWNPAPSNTVLQGYASFLGARYGGYRNLIWVIGGDADPNDSTMYAALNTFALALKAADPGRHLMAIEACRFTESSGPAPNGGYSSVDALTLALGSVPAWLDVNWVYQTQATVLSGAQRCYSQGYPCLLGEDDYEGDGSLTSQQIRQEGYNAVLGGCTLGRLFGNATIWPFNSANSGDPASLTPPWQSQLGSPGAVGQQLMGKLFRSREWQKLVPDTSNVVMTVGASNGSACARTSDGQSIIVYLPSSQTVTIDMTKITDAGSLANCNWYSPLNGAVTNIGTFANTGTRNFISPDSNDWVLVIDSNAANLRTPGT